MSLRRRHPAASWARARWERARAERERGEAVEMAILAAVLILATLMIVQVWMYSAANNTARSAAEAGLQATRAESGGSRSGQDAAQRIISSGGFLNGPGVSATRGPERSRVVVTGTATSLIPGVDLPEIRAEASGATERVTGP